MRKLLASSLVLIAAFAADASAQSTVGEVLDAKGKRLSLADFRSQIVGRKLSGGQAPGGNELIDETYADGGSYSGTQKFQSGRLYGVSGSWKAEGSGKVCRDMTYSQSNVPPRSG